MISASLKTKRRNFRPRVDPAGSGADGSIAPGEDGDSAYCPAVRLTAAPTSRKILLFDFLMLSERGALMSASDEGRRPPASALGKVPRRAKLFCGFCLTRRKIAGA